MLAVTAHMWLGAAWQQRATQGPVTPSIPCKPLTLSRPQFSLVPAVCGGGWGPGAASCAQQRLLQATPAHDFCSAVSATARTNSAGRAACVAPVAASRRCLCVRPDLEAQHAWAGVLPAAMLVMAQAWPSKVHRLAATPILNCCCRPLVLQWPTVAALRGAQTAFGLYLPLHLIVSLPPEVATLFL